VPLSCEQSRRLTEFACSQEGKPFDTVGFILPVFACPVRKFKPRCLSPEELDTPRWFCSSIVVAAGVVAGLLDPRLVRPRHTDPEDLKTDRPMNLSRCWQEAVRWHRCGERTHCWWSRTCDGRTQWWSD
jgi:hypothetical protein